LIGCLTVPHDIGSRPAYVTVQVKFTKGGVSYISEAAGNLSKCLSDKVRRLDSLLFIMVWFSLKWEAMIQYHVAMTVLKERYISLDIWMNTFWFDIRIILSLFVDKAWHPPPQKKKMNEIK
jgi:hypothetical protein